jgi:hypothetical protein
MVRVGAQPGDVVAALRALLDELPEGGCARVPARLLQQVAAPGWGGRWPDVAAALDGCAAERGVLDALAGERARHGGFAAPVGVDVDDDDGWEVVDGVRRVVVAAAADAPVEVRRWSAHLPDPSESLGQVEVEVAVAAGAADPAHAVVCALRSFRLTADVWVTADLPLPAVGGARAPVVVAGWWTCPPALADLLAAALERRLADAGLRARAEVLGVEAPAPAD